MQHMFFSNIIESMSKENSQKSKIAAYAAISAAFGTLLLTVGAYTGLGEFFWYFAASVCGLITFSRSSVMCTALSFLVCSFLSLLTTGFNFVYLLPYFVFFGVYPIAMLIEIKFNVNKALIAVFTLIWFNAAMYVLYIFTKLFVTDIAFIKDNLILLIIVGGSIVFLAYRFVMKRIQQKIESRLG